MKVNKVRVELSTQAAKLPIGSTVYVDSREDFAGKCVIAFAKSDSHSIPCRLISLEGEPWTELPDGSRLSKTQYGIVELI